MRQSANWFCQSSRVGKEDVERAIGVLQAHFAFLCGPARFWERETLEDIIKACTILDNMIIEDERELDGVDFYYETTNKSSPEPLVSRKHTTKTFWIHPNSPSHQR